MNFRSFAAALAATVAMPFAAAHATDLEVTHWWTSGGEAAAVAELAKAFDATGNKWVDGAIAGSGGTARPIMISRITGGDPMGATQFNHGRQAEELVEAGLMKDLTAVAEKEGWKDIVKPASLLESCTIDGKIYCAPVNIHSWQWLWLQAAIAQGVDPAIFGDFSEEALAQGIQKLVDMRVQEQVSAALGKALAPLKEQQETQAVNSHFSAIYKAHPDADSIAESKELADWVNAQPSFARAGYQAVLQNGTTEQVIEFFDQFKQATGKATQQPTDGKPDVAAAAQAALAKAKAQVPTSLSEIPAGAKAHHDEAEALMEMSDSNALNSFMGKSPEQIRALLERAL